MLRKHTPRCGLPAPSVLKRFAPADRVRLERILGETLECVVDPSFALRSAEALHGQPLPEEPPRESDEGDGVRRRSLPRGLTREQERDLFLRFNYARYRMMRILRAHRGARLSSRAAVELLSWEALARAARDRIVQHNLGLVPTMIERARITGVDFSELISEGQMALLRSTGKFDCSRGFKFSTYACRAILSSISRSVALTVRHRNHFPTEFDPDLQRGDELERRRETIEGDFVVELNAVLAANLADLTSAEKRVLMERFGVVPRGASRARKAEPRPKTLRQVAQIFGVTKERVRQIQNKALSKLRSALEDRVFAA